MARLTEDERIEQLTDQYTTEMVESVGSEPDDWEEATRTKVAACTQFFGIATLIVDASGVVPKIEAALAAERCSNAGRPADIPVRAVLILQYAHSLAGDPTPNRIAATLQYGLSDSWRKQLQIQPPARSGFISWRDSYWRAEKRLLEVMDPFRNPFDGRTHLTAEQSAIVHAAYSEARHDFMDTVANALIAATIRRLPKRYRNAYVGNVALDATRVKVSGRWNSPDPAKRRRNTDPVVTVYKRDKFEETAYELETAVTAPNKPDQQGAPMPTLISGVAFHRAGRLKQSAWIALEAHLACVEKAKYLIVDRAYNNLKAERFQARALKAGFRPVYSYKSSELKGRSVQYQDLLQVDGNWYVNVMPDKYINASRDRHDGLIDEAEYQDRLAHRARYRLIPKGKVDADGAQRYSYPDPAGYRVFSKITGRLETARTPKTITIPCILEAQRHQQYLQYQTPKWQQVYGLRNVVESSNGLAKSLRTGLDNPRLRMGHGFVYQYFRAVMACMAENIHRIVRFLHAQYTEAVAQVKGPMRRARRRRDFQTQQPLARVTDAAESANGSLSGGLNSGAPPGPTL